MFGVKITYRQEVAGQSGKRVLFIGLIPCLAPISIFSLPAALRPTSPLFLVLFYLFYLYLQHTHSLFIIVYCRA